MKEDSALDAVVGFRRVVGGSVRQAATDQPVGIVAAAGNSLARDRLPSWIDASYVCADGTANPFRISRTVGVDVLEIVQLFGRDSARRVVRVRRHGERNAVAPSPTHLCGQKLGIDLVLVRLQEVFEADDVGLGLLEDRKAAVQAQGSRLGYLVVHRVFPQDEEPWLARLLVIGLIVLRAAANGGRRDGVGVSEVNFGSGHGLAVLQLQQRHPVLAPDFFEGISLDEPGTQPVGIARHRIRADGVQRHQDVIVPASEPVDPVPGRARSGIADQLGAWCGPFDERAE